MLVAAGAGPLVPAWLAFPVGAVLVVVIALHLQSLKRADMPASRKRIRSANGWLMLAAAPITAYAFGAATTQNARVFMLVWLTVAGLLGMVMLLACLDVLNNRRLHRSEQRRLGSQIGAAMPANLRRHLTAEAGGGGSGGSGVGDGG